MNMHMHTLSFNVLDIPHSLFSFIFNSDIVQEFFLNPSSCRTCYLVCNLNITLTKYAYLVNKIELNMARIKYSLLARYKNVRNIIEE